MASNISLNIDHQFLFWNAVSNPTIGYPSLNLLATFGGKKIDNILHSLLFVF